MSSLDGTFFDLTQAFRGLLFLDEIVKGSAQTAPHIGVVRAAIQNSELLEREKLSAEQALSEQIAVSARDGAPPDGYEENRERKQFDLQHPVYESHGPQTALYRALALYLPELEKTPGLDEGEIADRVVQLIGVLWDESLNGAREIEVTQPIPPDMIPADAERKAIVRAKKWMKDLLWAEENNRLPNVKESVISLLNRTLHRNDLKSAISDDTQRHERDVWRTDFMKDLLNALETPSLLPL